MYTIFHQTVRLYYTYPLFFIARLRARLFSISSPPLAFWCYYGPITNSKPTSLYLLDYGTFVPNNPSHTLYIEFYIKTIRPVTNVVSNTLFLFYLPLFQITQPAVH